MKTFAVSELAVQQAQIEAEVVERIIEDTNSGTDEGTAKLKRIKALMKSDGISLYCAWQKINGEK